MTFKEFKEYIKKLDVKDNAEIDFIDVGKFGVHGDRMNCVVKEGRVKIYNWGSKHE